MPGQNYNAPFWVQLRAAEKGIIEFALTNTRTAAEAASALGINPGYLSRRIRDLGIPPQAPKGIR